MYLILFSYSVHIQLMLQNTIMWWWISCKTNTITPINSFCSGSTLARVMACCSMALAITWTNVDWSSVNSSDIRIRAISQPPMTIICLKITYIKFHSNFPWVNELKKMESPIQINKIQYLNYNQLTHSSKAILEWIPLCQCCTTVVTTYYNIRVRLDN